MIPFSESIETFNFNPNYISNLKSNSILNRNFDFRIGLLIVFGVFR